MRHDYADLFRRLRRRRRHKLARIWAGRLLETGVFLAMVTAVVILMYTM